ncbi:MAG: restriction endonuclease subunit S [Deltaproteobacteria bacterium]|nr:restriction endonuclease subunit S [Deltaproteobacteria bacterium]
MSGWKETPFAKLLVDSKDGEWGAGEEAVGLRQAIIIRGTDFADLDNPAAEFPKRWIQDHLIGRKKLGPGDIILETAGGTSTQSTGRSALLKESFFQKHRDLPVLCASFSRHLRLDTENYSPRFTYYLLQTLHRYGYMAVFNIQHTGVSRFQYTAFKNHTELRIPALPTQQKIAAILSAYDELIENNKRRIALLEKLAEEIYREWFVRLRFPGYEKVKKVKGVPAGWTPTPSNKVFRVMSGGTPNTDNPVYWDGDIPFFTPKDADDNFYVLKTERAITQKGLDSCNSRLYQKDTIFITARGTVGKICLAHREMAMNQTCYALSPSHEGDAYFYFLSMKNAIAYIKGVSKSGVFDNIIVDTFKIIPIFMPPGPLIERFNECAAPIFKQIGTLLEQNEVLTKSRDMLLPRLISGTLSVDNLDIQFPPSMAEELKAEPTATVHA